MSPLKKANMPEQIWTPEKMRLLLALIAKGVHIPGRGKKRTTDTAELQQIARMDFVDAFNRSLNTKFDGTTNYELDLPSGVILAKLDEVLVERSHVLGPGGLVERNSRGRLTRFMSLVFKRNRDCNFTGSLIEWKDGRREKVINKYRADKGMGPLSGSVLNNSSGSNFGPARGTDPATAHRTRRGRIPAGIECTPSAFIENRRRGH